MSKNDIVTAIIETPKPLSDEQRLAVLSDKKYLRIVAGAGAGKTETMTRRIAYLLLHKGILPKQIVAFTFTEKAAQSIKDRIYKRVRELKGDDACAQLGEMYVGTIHAYCFRLLQDHFGYGDYDVLDDNQEMAFMLREGWGFGLGGSGKYSENCESFLRSINVVYDELLDKKKVEKEDEKFAHHYSKYEELLKKHKLLTFGQMTSLAVANIEKSKDALAGIEHLIVDEYQDINKAQERLIELIGERASVYVVGDPRQCIYQWRGSDVACFDNFLKKYPSAKSIDIMENRRSGECIVTVANRVASTLSGPKYQPMFHKRPIKGETLLVACDDNLSEASWIIDLIKEVVNKKKLCNYSDIAILLRSVSTSAAPFVDAFKREGIPYLVGGKVGLFRRDEAQALGRLFAWFGDNFWIEDPYNWAKKTEGKLLLTEALQNWRSALRLSKMPNGINERLDRLKTRVITGKYKCFTEIYKDLLIELGFLDLDPDNPLDAAIMANLGRFNELLTDYETSIRRGGGKPDWESDLKGLCWYMNSYASGAYEEQPADDLRGTNALQIMTIHQAKGLEWPIVFVPCMTVRRFPSSKAGTKRKWYIPESLFDVQRYQGGEDDEKRLLYVALTRAMDILAVSRFCSMNDRSRSASIFWDIVKKVVAETDESTKIVSTVIEKPPDVEEIQTYSAGEIIHYMRCPYSYRLRDLWGYQPELVMELGFGKSLHHCLHVASQKIKMGTKPSKAVEESVQESFHLPFAGEGKKEKLREAAEKMLKEFVRKNEADIINIEETESRLEFPVENATITGRVDVIIKDKDKTLEVRDYKTSDVVTTLDESSLQVRLYAKGLSCIGKTIHRASIAYLETGEVDKVKIADGDLDIAIKTAQASIQGIQKSIFKGKAGKHCEDRCDYNRICRYKKV